MMTFGESEEPLEEKAEEKAPPHPFYDPLIAPWDSPLASPRSPRPEPDAEEFSLAPEYAPPSPMAWPHEEMATPARPYEEIISSPYEEPAAPVRSYGELGSITRTYEGAEEVSSIPLGPGEAGEALTDIRRRLQQDTVALPEPAKRRWSVTAREVVETLLLALLIFLAVRTSLQNFRVEGQSMMPSLDNGEYLIVNKLAYAEIDLSLFNWLPLFEAKEGSTHHLWGAPSRGDVIVFRSPTSLDRDFIKRIIGVPGDTVQIDPTKGVALLNGQALEERYAQGQTTCLNQCGPWTVPPGSYFVMGDNRQNSSDSRSFGFVPEENIIGKALITYWHDGQLELELAPNHSISFASEAAAEE